MSSITPYITKAGLAAIWNETHNGFAAKITHVGVGVSQFTQAEIDAIADRTTLKGEVARWPVTDAEQVTPSQIYLYVEGVSAGINNPANCDANGGFWVNNVGFFFEDGTLFAIYPVLQGNVPEGYKSPNSILDLDYQLALEAVPAGSVTVVNTGIRFQPGVSDAIAAAFASSAAATISIMQQEQRLTSMQSTISALQQSGTEVSQILLGKIAESEMHSASEIRFAAQKFETEIAGVSEIGAATLAATGAAAVTAMQHEQRIIAIQSNTAELQQSLTDSNSELLAAIEDAETRIESTVLEAIGGISLSIINLKQEQLNANA